VGVKVKAGQLKKGTTLIALNPTHGHVVVGDVASIQSNQVEVDTAKEGDEVCIKVVGSQGEAPKLLGRHFEQTDVLVTRINRESINLLKEWWSEEMTKSDWKLVIKLKKVFNIM
jgi:translation initiation factor 5B